MSAHWRLAAWGAALTISVSLVAAVVVGYYFDVMHAGAFLYGAAIGVLSFTSIAMTAALLGGRISSDRIVLGLAVYFGRLVFAAGAVGIPLYLESWPALPMLCGFAGVYVVENLALLFGASKTATTIRRPVSERVERREGV
ncbi:MAG: hypothetical protein M3397_01645 [Actinomycetota bacterium]|nr:hypothetical protein [Actinomycetota bacterium]MDQ3566769.1 hypothetical protein [Actinomycetota bacterium]